MLSVRRRIQSTRRRGLTLIEVVVVMTIMGVMIAIPVPTFLQAVEQSKLDIASGDLRAIWAAQRFFHLENGRYGTLAELSPGTGGDTDLLESSLTSGASYYVYTITVADDGQSFLATATHPDLPQCSGSVTIDHRGTLTSGVTYGGEPMTPSMEPGP